MNTGMGFQRLFLIFVNEDGGYEAGQKPSGHVRIETRDGKGKLHASIQNLRPGNGRFRYFLYLIDSNPALTRAALAGELVPSPGKAELEWGFDPRNVDGTGAGIGEFDVAAVLAEHAGHSGDMVVCPLAAYKGKKAEWRKGVRAALLQRKMQVAAVLPEQEQMQVHDELPGEELTYAVPKKEYGFPQGHYQEESADSYQPQPIQQYQVPPFQGYQVSPEQENLESLPMQQNQEISPMQQYQEMPLMQQYQEALPIQQNQEISPMQQYQELPQMQQYQETLPKQFPLGNEMPGNDMNQHLEQQETVPEKPADTPYPAGPDVSQTMQNQAPAGQIDTGCVYLNGNMCNAFVNTNASAVNPCASCHMHHGRQNYMEPPVGDIVQLREELGRYFEECDPFHSHRSDYTWWRVGNPVNLNNLLYQCNIRSPLLFNPVVMMAHYKYRHLIVGIYRHKAREKEYVVCGVPGMSLVDKKPFGDMSRWVQAEGNRPRYGAFGYWLVYIDPEGGRILNWDRE